MLAWFASHYGDLIVLVILGLIVGAVIASTVRGRKKESAAAALGVPAVPWLGPARNNVIKATPQFLLCGVALKHQMCRNRLEHLFLYNFVHGRSVNLH